MALFPNRSSLGNAAPVAKTPPPRVTPPPATPANGASAPAASEASEAAVNPAQQNGTAGGVNASAPSTPPPSSDGMVADFRVDEMTMQVDEEDTDFDEQLLRLSHRIHSVL